MPKGTKIVSIMTKIITMLVKRPLVTKLILIFIFLGSAFSFKLIERNSYPPVDLHTIDIKTIYPGASPEDVEINITSKIEQAIKPITGIKYVTSQSMENQSKVKVALDQEYKDLAGIKDEIRRAVDNISDLPNDLEERPFFFETKVDNFPVYDVALIWEGKSEKETRAYLRDLKRKIERLPMIAKVTSSGERKEEVQILLNLQKMNKLAVSFQEVLASIKENKLRLSGGQLESFVHRKGIITISEFEKIEDIKKIIVRSNEAGKRIRIHDLGIVKNSLEKENIITRYNGLRGQGLWVYKKPGADIINTVDQIKETVILYKKNDSPKGMNFVSTHDTSFETRSRLRMVSSNVILGLALVLGILLYFFNFKLAIWTALGIPVSLALAMALLPFFGITINSISLCGVIVVLGMIVDDAIIVSESIYRKVEEKSDRTSLENILAGVQSVAKPVCLTIFTTLISFIPIYFIPGMVGQFTAEIPTVVILVLTASLLEALFFLPVHLYGLQRGEKDPPGTKLLIRLERSYEKSLSWLLEKGIKSFLVILSALVLILGGLFLKPDFELFPSEQASRIYIYGQVSSGKTLHYTNKRVASVEKEISNLMPEEVRSYRTRVGRSYLGNNKCIKCFYVKVELTSFDSRKRNAIEIAEAIKAKVSDKYENFNFRIDNGAPPLGSGVEIHVLGENNLQRANLVSQIEKELGKLPLGEIENNSEMGNKTYKLVPIYKNISRFQTSVSQIAKTIRVAFEGSIVSHIQRSHEKIPFRVLLDESSQNFNSPLEGLKVLNKKGHLIELEKLVNVVEEDGASVIHHYDFDRATTIKAKLLSSNKKDIYSDVKKSIGPILKDFPKMRVDIGGEVKKSHDAYQKTLMAFILAIVGIYIFLTIQFNSFSTPLVIVSAIPFGLMGILISFKMHSTPLSFMALIGIVGFSGVVINDSLIMVDLIDKMKKESGDLLKNIVAGAKIRMRPIILTTVTTVVGLLPSIYGIIGDTDAFISPMVLAMGSGLIVGTVSVLYFIPLLYFIIGRFNSK